jgi:hypothetical protein
MLPHSSWHYRNEDYQRKAYDLARLRIHRDPDPWFVPFLPDKAPPLIGFGIAPMTATEKAGSPPESNTNHASNPEARSS